MPLVRFQVRNEYALGDPELYRASSAASKKEDPKAILDGVAVAGLVGILRQLGDLAGLASDIFQDLHEQVMATSARGRKLSARIQHLETELPLFENAIQGQRSHIHFAYVPGSDWHADLKFEQSRLLSSDLPQFMMDSYEECRDPPRFFVLDKFDTAGTGACLKRYSDPSYFKRVWAASGLVKAEKVQREKKVQKIKRKGSKIKNGERQNSSVSLSRRYSSTRFSFPSADEERSSTETPPISDMKLKPELASRSPSFGSRRLNYAEQVNDTNSQGMYDELDHDKLSLSNLQINGSFASDIHESLTEISTYNSSPPTSLKEGSVHRSPSVTWEEKTEILKPTSPISCDDKLVDDTQPSQSMSSEESDIEPETYISGTQTHDTANLPARLSRVNHFDEINSETDNYMDALNTLESETETDSEYPTKRELKSFSSSGYPQMEPDMSQMQEMDSQSSDISTADTPSESHSSLNEDESQNTCNLMPSESLEPVNPPHSTSSSTEFSGADTASASHSSSNEESLNIYNFIPSENLETLKPSHSPDCIVDQDSSIGRQNFKDDHFDMSAISSVEGINNDKPPESSICSSPTMLEPRTNSPGSPPNNSSISSANFWTNGFLLGLEPSKPPVLSVSNISGSSNSGYDNSSSLGASNLHDNGLATDPEPRALSNEIILEDSSFIKKTDGPPNGCNISVPRGLELPNRNSVESQPNESGQNTRDITSSLSALAQRILSNSLQRKLSIAESQHRDLNPVISKPQDTSETGVLSEACYAENNYIEHLLEKTLFSSNSHLSGHSSPPLEHMKIAFHPMNGLETSKLKLEYASGSSHESIEDLTFPSFQLLPGPDLPLEENGSETDDDTFCRSCPCTSEDQFSPRSDSNSEFWEQDDKSGEKNHGMYNDLSRVALSTSSVSSFKGFDQISQKDPALGYKNLEAENSISYFQNSVGIPGLDSFIPENDEMFDFLSKNPEVYASQSQNELPPLPPMQWRTMKEPFDKEDERDSSVSEIIEHLNDFQVQSFSAHRKQEEDIPKPPPFPETMAYPIKKPHDGQKVNGHEETINNDVNSKQLDVRKGLIDQIRNKHDSQKLNGHKELKIPFANGQEVDEGEDLLHQIRNKTFNLRRTSAAKTGLVPQPTTNVSVAAILEKANAIRQAFVGSDDGEDDDNWSDS